MIAFILFILFVIVFFTVPFVPFFLRNLHNFIRWGAIDTYYYFKHKEYNRCNYYGRIMITSAFRNKVFGSGKTLNLSMVAHDLYKLYDNKPVWDDIENKFVPQRIHLISNITLNGVPYTKFVSCEQLKNVEQNRNDVTIFVFDEIGAIWNSRNYKDNISTDLLRSLLQVRHNKIGIIGSTQRFKFVDALLRQVTGTLLCVKKTWRSLMIAEYDPVDFEYCQNTTMLQPLSKKYRFVFNEDYLGYDTNEVVPELMKLDLLPDAEVLANQNLMVADVDCATGVKRKYRKRKR